MDHVYYYEIDKSKIDDVFKSNQHSLDVDLLEMFRLSMKNLSFDFGKSNDRVLERIDFQTDKYWYEVDYSNIVPYLSKKSYRSFLVFIFQIISTGGEAMDGNQLLMELIKITDMKIDLMEYVIEKMTNMSPSSQREFIRQSSSFDKIDWLNMEFLSHYQRFLAHESIKEISQVQMDKYVGLKDLKHLVMYALELETSFESLVGSL